MGKVISIVNQKGGCSKSTTAVNLMAGLVKKGYKVLGIDLDSQRCLTSTFRGTEDKATSLSVLLGEATIKEAIQHTPEADIVPASRGLVMADSIITKPRKEYSLKEAVDTIKSQYDFIVIDCSPALGVLTINALVASDSIVIPLLADIYSLEGVRFLMDTVIPVKKQANPALTIEGLLLTQYEPRAILSKEVKGLASKFAESIGSKLFNATIRRSITVREAQATQQSLYSYAPQAKVTADYTAFIEELLGDKQHG